MPRPRPSPSPCPRRRTLPVMVACVLLWSGASVAPLAAQQDPAGGTEATASGPGPAAHPAAAPRAGDPEAWPGEDLPVGAELRETPSGLRYALVAAGIGEPPGTRFDSVTVHYDGMLADGTPFDSSRERGQPYATRLDQVVAGWGEGLQLVAPGGRIKLVIPPELGYGARGRPPVIPAGATLVFDVELLSVDRRVELPAFLRPAPEACSVAESGLMQQVLVEGDGQPIGPRDGVTIEYTVWLADGTVLDSSRVRGRPIETACDRLTLAGLREGLQRMRGGGRSRFVLPAILAYGESGFQNVPPSAELIYEVEVIEHRPQAPPMPVPAFRLPADEELTTTGSGLRHLLLEPGSGDRPGPTDTVTVHYAGWLLDGTPFDDSYSRGEPTTFPLDRVIRGWTEGLGLMRPGGRAILVIPPDLGYGTRGSPPVIPGGATLVFQVELISIGG